MRHDDAALFDTIDALNRETGLPPELVGIVLLYDCAWPQKPADFASEDDNTQLFAAFQHVIRAVARCSAHTDSISASVAISESVPVAVGVSSSKRKRRRTQTMSTSSDREEEEDKDKDTLTNVVDVASNSQNRLTHKRKHDELSDNTSHSSSQPPQPRPAAFFS
jgi:hypothetical protein